MSTGGIVSKAVHCEPLGDVNGIELQGTEVEVLKHLKGRIQRSWKCECSLSHLPSNTAIPTSTPMFLSSMFILNNDPREKGWGWSEKEQPVLLINPEVSPEKIH